jgi:ABC-type dipeptide/oligopeptide/nickel transport system ATPase component
MRLLIAMVGTQGSGKSCTWVELFKIFSKIDPKIDSMNKGFYGRNKFQAPLSIRNVRTKNKVYTLNLTNTKSVKLFLIAGSLEEKEKKKKVSIQEFIKRNENFEQAAIILCSIQYADNMLDDGTTLDYFIREGYDIYIHWLNPGINEQKFDEDCDLVNQIQHKENAFLEIYKVEKDVFEPRIQKIIDYMCQWVSAKTKD